MSYDRFSDQMLSAPCVCYVLFNGSLQATLDEILDAADQDFPGLNWGYTPERSSLIDTHKDISVSDTTGTIQISCSPGRLKESWDDELHNSFIFFPHASEAVAEHTDYLRISVAVRGGDTRRKARFNAARQMTCLSAVLANLPTATAVYLPSAEKLVMPALWNAAATTTIENEVPVLRWLTIGLREFFDDEGMPICVSAYTIGLAPFFGQEFVLPRIKCPAAEAEVVLAGIVSMAFEMERPYRDGEVMGFSDRDESFRVRICPEGVQSAATEQVWFLHKSCDLDDRALLGGSALEEEQQKERTRSEKYHSQIAKRVAARV